MLKKKKNKEKTEQKTDDRESDRYRGLDPKTILKKLMSGLKPRDEKIALEFIDIETEEVIKSASFAKLPRNFLKMIVSRNGLSCEEVVLFDAVVNWAQADCKTNGREVNAENLRKTIGDILSLIRFPTMSLQEIAARVAPTSIILPDQILQLYTWLGSNEEKRKGVELPWPTEKRLCAFKQWAWDPEKKNPQIMLSEKNMVASCAGTSWVSVFGDKVFKDGMLDFEIELTQYDTSNSYNVAIGIVPGDYTNWQLSTVLAYQNANAGWAFICGTGNRCHQTDPTHYGSPCTQGDVIRCRVDLRARTMEMYRNGLSMGVMYSDVTGPVRPAVSLVSNQRVTLRFPKRGGK
jgi:hypothetical protein